MKPSSEKKSISKLIKEGFFAGIGWAAGVTVGFAIVSTVIVYSLRLAGGIPFVGGFFAQIVDATVAQTAQRNPSNIEPTPSIRR